MEHLEELHEIHVADEDPGDGEHAQTVNRAQLLGTRFGAKEVSKATNQREVFRRFKTRVKESGHEAEERETREDGSDWTKIINGKEVKKYRLSHKKV